MKQLYPDLWQTKQEHPFAGLNTHAYFLQRAEGNVLFYNTGYQEELAHIIELGGIDYQYLSHSDEVGQSLIEIKKQCHAKLCCHELEAAIVNETCEVDIYFAEKTIHSDTIHIIPTPGHTSGSLSFLYQSPYGKTYLFTGDMLYQDNGEWNTLVLNNQGGRYDDLIKSLQLLHGLEVDVVMCSASVGEVSIVEVTPTEWKESLEKIINNLSN